MHPLKGDIMNKIKIRNHFSWYMLLFIPLLGTIIFNIYPLIQTIISSFQNVKGSFIGPVNYKIMFGSSEFQKSMINTLYMAVLGVAFNVPIAFIIASMLNSITKLRNIYKVIFLLPMIMSMVTVATMFKYLMMPDETGLFNFILGKLGMEPKLWLNSVKSSRESLVFIAIWKGIGYNIILFFAGMQSISKNLYEAAEIDGANEWHKWRYVTIPSAKNTFSFVLVTSCIAALKRFTEAYAIGAEAGNPAGSLETIMLYIYRNSFSTLNYKDEGLASAASIILFLIILAATGVNYSLTNKKDDGYGKSKKRRKAGIEA